MLILHMAFTKISSKGGKQMELTAQELKALNEISMERNSAVQLGHLLSEHSVAEIDTPVKFVKASKNLTVSGVVVNGETITISNPALGHVRDRYEFRTDDAQSVTEVGNIPVNISTHAVKASVTLSVEAQPTSGDKMTIGTKEFTFVPDGTANAEGEVSIGTDLATAQANILAAINGTDGFNDPHPLVTAGEFTSDDTVLTALVGGTVGNAIASTETFTHVDNHFSGVTLSGGTNCSAQNAIDHLVAEVTAHDTQGIEATDATGGVVTLSAKVAGAAGNDITIAETMVNGAFAGAATKLSGGVTGTPVYDGKLMMDSSYLYVYVEALSDWRRIGLGSAY
jgi:hypothetical protein